MSNIADRLKSAVLNVTKDWAKQRKAEERRASAAANREAKLTRASDYYNFKSAAEEIMEEAYLKASANGTLPASARQVMYQARPFIQEMMGGQQLDGQYFTQTLLPDYIEEYGVEWDITYDDRGHFTEPHTGLSFGLGTINVRDYLSKVSAPILEQPSFAEARIVTRGPDGRFGAVLFIEKEGFDPLIKAARIAERFDIAPMSTKGMSVTAARSLADACQKYDIPLLLLHDFDKNGFSIASTMQRDTRRYKFQNSIATIDLGMRLTDVQELGLEASAEAVFDRGSDAAKLRNLRLNGATKEEAEFVLRRRVELNALTSDQLVAFIERKLTDHGIKKVIPEEKLLADAYRLFVANKRIEEVVTKAIEDMDTNNIKTPANLGSRVEAYLQQHPELSWDEAVAAIVDDDRPRAARKKSSGAYGWAIYEAFFAAVTATCSPTMMLAAKICANCCCQFRWGQMPKSKCPKRSKYGHPG
jgi:hypothetical protein